MMAPMPCDLADFSALVHARRTSLVLDNEREVPVALVERQIVGHWNHGGQCRDEFFSKPSPQRFAADKA